MRMITLAGYRGRNHDTFEVHTMDATRLTSESVESPEYKREKERRIKLYQERVKEQLALGDD